MTMKQAHRENDMSGYMYTASTYILYSSLSVIYWCAPDATAMTIWSERNFRNGLHNRSDSLVVVWLLPLSASSRKQAVNTRECLPAFATFYYGNVAPTEARSTQRKLILLFSSLKGNVKVKWSCVDSVSHTTEDGAMIPGQQIDFPGSNFGTVRYDVGMEFLWNACVCQRWFVPAGKRETPRIVDTSCDAVCTF